MKKTLCIVLITAMLLSIMPMVVFADTTPTGTAITTEAELLAMKDGQAYYLANDITIKGGDKKEWFFRPDANTWEWKNGTLDGNGHTITYANGLTIQNGLIRGASGVTIKNLNVVQAGEATYIGDGGEVSALIRRVTGGTVTITNVSVYANIVMTSENSANQCGGLVAGLNRPATLYMENCVFSGSITKEHYDNGENEFKGVGGMLGGTWTDANGGIPEITMKKCINYANITSSTYTGGIFGFVRNGGQWGESTGIRKITIENCVNYGAITCKQSEFVGGIFGFYRMNAKAVANFKYNINYGAVKAEASNGVAGGIGGGLREENTTNTYLFGNVNYGTIVGTIGQSGIIGKAYNSSGTRGWNPQYNYCSEATTQNATSGSQGSPIDSSTMTNLATTFGADLYTTLPNGKITLTWAKQAGYADALPTTLDAVLVGAQLSGNATDETRNIRFVGGLTETEGLTNIGVLIIAKDSQGKQLKVFEGMTETVYRSIYADDEEIFATEYEKDYFFTAVVNNVPTELGAVTFELRTFQIAKNGTLGYSYPKTLTVDFGELPDSYFRDGWTLSIPAYEGGTLATAAYDAGTGLVKDTNDNATAADADRSYMMCISNTNEAEFEAYEAKLVEYGYALDSANTLAGVSSTDNLYRQYRKSGKLVYIYFNEAKSEARVILDVSSVAETEFEYSFEADASTATEIYMYGMKYSNKGLSPTDDGGDASTPNNGAFYIIKQADNSVILIDGGGELQATTAAKEGLWNFLREITGTGENERVTVACWIVTHPHEDHYKLAYDLLRDYRSQIDLQRVMFNFPNPAVTGEGLWEFRGSVQTYYPNVKFLKCHTGQSIHLGSLDIDILMTHEDLVNATTGASILGDNDRGGNSMTSVMMFTLADGTKFLSLGDFEEEAQSELFGGRSGWFTTVTGYLDKSELECDIITVAHHGYNDVATTYAAAKAKYALWSNYSHESFPQSGDYDWRYDRADDMIEDLNNAAGGTCNIYYAGKNTVKLTCVNGSITATLTDPVY